MHKAASRSSLSKLPANYFSEKGVQQHRQVYKRGEQADIGDIGDPELIVPTQNWERRDDCLRSQADCLALCNLASSSATQVDIETKLRG